MRTLNVYLNASLVGLLSQNNNGRLGFTYVDSWIARTNSMPLSQSLPLRKESFDQRECQAYFAGLLPDEGQRTIIARNLGISSQNDFSMLEKIGGECAGAVTILSEEAKVVLAPYEYRDLTDNELSNIFSELPKRPLLAGDVGLRLSLAGAQNKLAVRVHNGVMSLPLNGSPSTHILKPASDAFEGLVFNEAFCMRLAAAIDLLAAPVSIGRIDEKDFLLIERYDRSNSSGNVDRLHQEDFCQALGIPPWNKYQQEGGPGFKSCFDLVRTTCTIPVNDLSRLLDAVVFNLIVGNADAHGKNFSLLYRDGMTQLAPLYDIVSTMYYSDLSTHMSMKIGNEYDITRISATHFDDMAKQCALSAPMVKQRVTETANRIHGALDKLELEFENEITETLRAMIVGRCKSLTKFTQ